MIRVYIYEYGDVFVTADNMYEDVEIIKFDPQGEGPVVMRWKIAVSRRPFWDDLKSGDPVWIEGDDGRWSRYILETHHDGGFWSVKGSEEIFGVHEMQLSCP